MLIVPNTFAKYAEKGKEQKLLRIESTKNGIR
jgi:hypothetical protein